VPACCAPERQGEAPNPTPDATVHNAARKLLGTLVPVAGGTFAMGNQGTDAVVADGEGPVRRVSLAAFSIAATTVTNREFGEFIRATHYVTDAERLGSSFVFYLQMPAEARRQLRQSAKDTPWWLQVADASWQRPEGPGSHIYEHLDHPVVHVSWNDAQAYCAWTGTRLPTEAEWECAARGGRAGARFPWGDDLMHNCIPRCHVWRGSFPNAPEAGWRPEPIVAADGEPNGFGLINVCGNVWEWCADWFSPAYHVETAAEHPRFTRPTGRRSMRGGSFLCHDSYCNRYRVAARSSNTPESSSSNLGFRIAK
jgi:formylglycine-generating enzyme